MITTTKFPPNMRTINITKRFIRPALLVAFGLGAVHLQAAPLEDSYRWDNVRVGAGGFAPNILFSSQEPNLAYLRTDMGGIYRWDQTRQHWLPLQDSMAESSYFGVESLALDPQDKNGIYAAVGMYSRGASAILHSRDKGDHWEIYPVSFKMGGNEDGRGLGERLIVDPNDNRTLYFGSRHNGLQRSQDSGQHWQSLPDFPNPGLGLPANKAPTHAGISFVVIDGKSGSTGQRSQHLFAGVADPGAHHLYESQDAGAHWNSVPGEPDAELLPVKAQLDKTGNLYIAYSNGIGPNGITGGALFKLDIHTHQWQDITPIKSAKAPAGGYMGLSLDAQHPGTLVVSTINRWQPYDTLWRSTDGGNSWQDLYPNSHQDVTDTPFLLWGESKANFGWWIAGVAIDPFDSHHLAYVTGATVYHSRDIGQSNSIRWRPWDQGIEQTAIITLNSLPSGAELLSGFGDISGFYHDDLTRSPSLMYTNPVFANTNTIDYAGTQPNVVVRSGTPPHRSHGPVPTLAYSLDSGKSWQPLKNPEFQGDNADAMQRYVQAGNAALTLTATGKRFILATQTPYYTDDRGEHWAAISGLPDWVRPVADRYNNRRLYALDFDNAHWFISQDGGQHFSQAPSTGLPPSLTQDKPSWREQPWPLMATPDHPGDLWLISHLGLFHSQDGGRHFSVLNAGVQIEQLSFGKAPEGSHYPMLFAIGTDKQTQVRAIWRSADSGASWQRINDEQHQYGQRFRCLSGDPKHVGRVYIGTDGRGIIYGEPH